jgi:hypothetical protein
MPDAAELFDTSWSGAIIRPFIGGGFASAGGGKDVA